MTYAEQAATGEEVVHQHGERKRKRKRKEETEEGEAGITLFIDPKALFYMLGT